MTNFADLEIEFADVLGERALVLRSERLADLLDFAFTHDIRGVIVNEARGFRRRDLSELAGRRFIEAALVCGEFSNLSPLEDLPNLRRLAVSDSKAPFDVQRMPALERLSCDWTPGRTGICEAAWLRDLSLRKFKSQSKDLRPLSGLTSLQTLNLVQGNLASLAGIESFPRLRRVEVCLHRSLSDIRALAATPAPIEFLHLEGCSKLTGQHVVQHLFALHTLRMHRCGVIESLAFVRECPALRSFRFFETDVLDGDLSPLDSIEDVDYTQKSHFNRKRRG